MGIDCVEDHLELLKQLRIDSKVISLIFKLRLCCYVNVNFSLKITLIPIEETNGITVL